MVAVEFRAELEDPDLDRPLAARLSRGPVGRLPGVHGRETTGRADQVSVLPHHTRRLRGRSTQWPSSGKYRNLVGTPCSFATRATGCCGRATAACGGERCSIGSISI